MNHTFHRHDIKIQQARSPRQIAKKAYSTASKKISLDDRRKRQHYHMRERLLIQNTMMKAEMMLNSQSSKLSNSKVALSCPFDNIKTPSRHHYPPPPPLSKPEQLSATLTSHTTKSQSFPAVTLKETSQQPCTTISPTPSLLTANTSLQKSSTASITPFHFLHSIINYLRLPFFELFRLPSFISWSTFLFTKRDRGSCLHSTRISMAANFTHK
ncbi:hypothetical protein BCR42DRAFT_72819 [Absidia repens]|uniref:Uncharacterized protein n=1 Tax=Absidia repens TaxID=90262 RepID=A0A1X2IB98_9FUNG|nr:hypothetical protein BCR42DRAFT_72819 [Absidia repens]